MTDFQKALDITLRFEGGWADDKDDPGGQTMKGVTQKVYDQYLAEHSRDHQSVREISDAELSAIYYDGYWRPAGCDVYPWPLSSAMFDFAVNAGHVQAVRALQRLLGAKVDGRFGPQTRALVLSGDAKMITAELIKARRAFYLDVVRATPKSKKFLAGWNKRVDQLAALLQVV